MTSSPENLGSGVPKQTGHGDKLLKPTIPGIKAVASGPYPLMGKATLNAKDALEEEARARAEKTARLRAARQERDTDKTR